MWSENIGLRTRPVWDQKYRSWSWSCTLWSWSLSSSCRYDVVLWKTILSCSLSQWSWRTQQLFKCYLQFPFSVLGTSLLWRSTVAFTYLKVKSAMCLFYFRWSWSWSCYFGLSLGLGLVSSGLGFGLGLVILGWSWSCCLYLYVIQSWS